MEEAASSVGAITEGKNSLKATTNVNRSLLYMENLTLPSFQVIVMAANMQCNGCRARVSRIVSKMTGLTEYTVDVGKKQVTVKGDFIAHSNLQDEIENIRSNTLIMKGANKSLKSLLTCLTHSHSNA